MFSTAWDTEGVVFDNDDIAKDFLLNHWQERLKTIIKDSCRDTCYFVSADRTGFERGIEFLGSSCIIQLRPELKVLKNLNKSEENLLVHTLFL